MKFAFLFLSVLVSFGVGAAFGYRVALDNQTYYDAPEKIVLYSSILEKGKAEEYLRGQVVRQVRILNEPDSTRFKNELMLLLPPHGLEFKEAHEQYLASIKGKSAYTEALAFLCEHNEQYVRFCE